MISQDKHINASLNQALSEVSDDPIVSDLWWISLNSAPAEIQNPIFITPTPEKLDEWIQTMTTQNVSGFVFVTLDAKIVSDTNLLLEDHFLVTESTNRVGDLLVLSIDIKEKW